MTYLLWLISIVALITALIALSRGRMANERADDALRYLSDLRNRTSDEIKDIFRELNRAIVRQKMADGSIKKIPYEITVACVACGACEPECPTEAILPGDIFRIIPEKCKPCKKCVQACPVDACVVMALD